MLTLAIDTAANHCAAAVLDATGRELGRAVETMDRGHAERLMAVIADALGRASVAYADLGLIAVSVGPGSFTGVRVGVSAARGLALALAIPVVGVSTLEALASEASDKRPGEPLLAAIDARRSEIYLQSFDGDGLPLSPPAVTTVDLAAEHASATIVCGSAALALAQRIGAQAVEPLAPTADIAVFGRIAMRPGRERTPPSPLYLRQADAKPQQGFALARRSAP
jgi:tRNA threonylcarbamoyladenosine biosynthesis protein TsaB